jgi:ubiquitin-conjugating enzyme E2 Z
MSNTDKFMPKKNKKRLLRDISKLIKTPLTDNGIYYAHDSENMLKGYAMIYGPDDTIYRYGCYFFEFNYPLNYPFSPPKVLYMTNNGSTRFNPNLYRNGKVCLSLLNTWKGEQWTSCQTVKTILLNLVTLLHNKPMLNEPGIKESHRDFKPYNLIIQYENYRTAILNMIIQKNLPEQFLPFYHIFKQHFRIKKKDIIKELIDLETSDDNDKTVECRFFRMKCTLNYKVLRENLEVAFDEYL